MYLMQLLDAGHGISLCLKMCQVQHLSNSRDLCVGNVSVQMQQAIVLYLTLSSASVIGSFQTNAVVIFKLSADIV